MAPCRKKTRQFEFQRQSTSIFQGWGKWYQIYTVVYPLIAWIVQLLLIHGIKLPNK